MLCISHIFEAIEMSPELMQQAQHGSSVPEGRVPKPMFGKRIGAKVGANLRKSKFDEADRQKKLKRKKLALGVI